MELRDLMVEIKGANIHVFTKGHGKPLLWLHGANGNPAWTPFLESLSQEYRVYAPEHPGFGKSSQIDWVNDFEDIVYYYRSFLDHFEIDKAIVIGQSLGGWIAAEFAASQTHRVDKLILTAAAGLWQEGLHRVDSFSMSPDRMAEMMVYNKELANRMREQAKTEEAQQLAKKNLDAYARLAYERPYNPKLERILSWITVPSMVVWGEHDKIISPEYARLYAEYIPGAKMRMIQECGHLPYLEKKEEYLEIIREFLRE